MAPSATHLTGSVSTTNRSTTPVIVIFETNATRNRSVITDLGGTVTGGESIELLPTLFARIPTSAITTLRAHPGVADVVRDQTVTTTAQTTPWGIDRINATTASDSVNASIQSTVQVAVIDTGIASSHPELQANVAWGVNTIGDDEPTTGLAVASDEGGHGTHVAGTIGAVDNDRGVVGVAPNTELYAVKVLNDSGTGRESDLIEGIDRAVAGPDGTVGTADDAEVLSMSLGSTTGSTALESTIESASNTSVLVAAAGNSGDGNLSTDNVSYPAQYSEVIAVAASNRSDRVAGYSSDGPAVELTAPGTAINSTSLNGQYQTLSGTSMATPHVSGVVALLLAKDRTDNQTDLSTTQLRSLLAATAIDLASPGRDVQSGYGLIQADAAIEGQQIHLVLTLNRTTVTVGDAVAIRVTRMDTGAAINATVAINGTHISTGADGYVTHRFDTAGNSTLTASRVGDQFTTYRTDTATVTVTTSATASVTFDNTTVSNGTTTVAVDRYDFGPTGKALTIWTTTDSGTPAQRIAHPVTSPRAGTNVSVALTSSLTTTQSLIAAIHNNTTNLSTTSITVSDRATITVESDTPTDPRQRALQIAGKDNASALTQNDITIAITRFNRDLTANGLTITQDDITTLITLFERNN